MKRFKHVIPYTISSASSTLVEFVLFYFFMALSVENSALAVVAAMIVCKAVSYTINFILNRRYVFKSCGKLKHEIIKFCSYCIPQSLASMLLVSLVSVLPMCDSDIVITLMKAMIDIGLFFIGYYIQKKWVFNAPRPS